MELLTSSKSRSSVRARSAASAPAALNTAPIFHDFMKLTLKEVLETPHRVPPGQAHAPRRP